MRTRIKEDNYKVLMSDANNTYANIHIKTPVGVTVRDDDTLLVDYISNSLRLIVDETNMITMCSSMKKNKIKNILTSSESGYDFYIQVVNPKGVDLSLDLFTIEFDWGTSIEELVSLIGTVVNGFSVEENSDLDVAGMPCYSLVVDDSIKVEDGKIIVN